MTVITLPSGIAAQTLTPRYVDYGMNNEPVNGGTITRTDRPGNRFAVSGNFPPLKSSSNGQTVLSRLIQAQRGTLRLPFTQPGDALTGLDSATFSLSGTTGTSVSVAGVAGGVTIPEGRFFCFEQSGRSYLHQVVSFASNVLTFEPELRVATVAGTALEFNDTVIDGAFMAKGYQWEQWLDGNVSLPFDLVERW
jgi:hypothetical protein